MHRTATGSTTGRRRIMSFKDEAQVTKNVSRMKNDSFSCYQLDWQRLKAFLMKKFPGHEFEEEKRLDRYHFKVPERLSEEDRAEILKLRNKSDVKQRRAVTPDD